MIDRLASREDAAGSASFPNGWIAAGATFAVLLALLNNWLRFTGYPFLRPEVGIVVLVALGSSLLFGLVYAARGGVLVRGGLELALVLYAFEWAGASTAILIVAGLVTLGVLILRSSTLPPLGVAACAIMLISSLGLGQQVQTAVARSAMPIASRANTRPAIVHVILDEHIGVEGLPQDNPGSAVLARELRSFYQTHGFRLIGGAYAEQFHTRASVPYILNFGDHRWQEPKRARESMRDAPSWKMERNAYFDLLHRTGYAINVYQSDHIDYCAGQMVRSCLTYASENFRVLADSQLSRGSKAWLILARFTPYNQLLDRAGRASRWARARGIMIPDLDLTVATLVSTPAALHALDLFISDLGRARPGQAYFGHFLVPHYPYVLGRDCDMLERRRWLEVRARVPLRVRQDAYFDQVRCATRKMGDAIAAIRQSPVGDNFVMIVHGDHGSRLTRVDPRADRGAGRDDDMIAGYSTLFAVRARGIAAGYDPSRRPVAALLKEIATDGALAMGARGTGSVYLEDAFRTPRRRVPMPASWMNGSGDR